MAAPESLLVWHYTTGDCLESILADGEIRVAFEGVDGENFDASALEELGRRGLSTPTARVGMTEKPAVWFSTRITFEPTALKGIVVGGGRRSATLDEMERLAGGLVRIGVRADLVRVGWAFHTKRGGLSRKTALSLVRAAKGVGADPSDWRVHYGPVPRSMWSRVQVWRAPAWVDHAAMKAGA